MEVLDSASKRHMIYIYISLICVIAFCMHANASEAVTYTIGSGVYADYYSDTGELIIRGNGTIDATSDETSLWWTMSNEIGQSVKSVSVQDSSTVKLGGSCINMFKNWTSIETINLDNVTCNNTSSLVGMFYGCTNLKSINLSLNKTTTIKDMQNLFYGCKNLTTINFGTFDTSSVKYMNSMFDTCESLKSIDLSMFNTKNVIDMSNMFHDCINLDSIDLSNFNTSKTLSIGQMFDNCVNIKDIKFGENFTTAKVTNMAQVFIGCKSLTNLDLSTFNTSKVERMNDMFENCENLSEIKGLSNFNTSNVKWFSYMFSGCKSITELNLSNFVTTKATDIDGMFYDCRKLKTLDISSFDTSSLSRDGKNWFLDDCISLRTIQTPSTNSKYMTDLDIIDSGYGTTRNSNGHLFKNCTDEEDTQLYSQYSKSTFTSSKLLKRVVPYTVNHYTQIGDREPVLAETEQLYDIFDTNVTPEVKAEYADEGYSLPEEQTVFLDLDKLESGEIESIVVNYYYYKEAPVLVSMSVEYTGDDIYVNTEADPDDFTVILTYSDDTEEEIPLSECLVTNPNDENNLVVPDIQYNTFDVAYEDMSDTVDIWGYKIFKIKARYLGDPILVGNNYDENEVEVTYIYTPYHDGTHDEKIVTENLDFSSLLVTQVDDNSYIVMTPEGEADYIVPGKIEPDETEETVSGNDNTIDETVSGNDNPVDETVSGNGNTKDETVSGNNVETPVTPTDSNNKDNKESSKDDNNTTTEVQQTPEEQQSVTPEVLKSPVSGDSDTNLYIATAIIALIVYVGKLLKFKRIC